MYINGKEVELLAEIRANVCRHLRQWRQIPQMLLTREEGEQRQLLGLSSRMGRDKRPLVVRRAVERMQFAGGQGRFETWIGGAFDGSHRGKAPGEASEKGYAVR